MIKIALTGGIGSGKSTVCKLFNDIGIDTFDSDSSAKRLYLKPDIKQKVIDLVGERVLVNNEINSKLISDICFKDKNILDKLVSMVSDGVFDEYQELINKTKSPYTIFESAIILNSNKLSFFNQKIGVISDVNLRIKRVMDRSKLTEEQIMFRINKQPSDCFIVEHCDYIIVNNNDIKSLEQQVYNINSLILNSL